MNNVERTFLLLERVAAGPPVSQAELVRELGVSRSTVSDVLKNLESMSFVAEQSRRYVPGLRMLSLALRTTRHVAVPAPVADALAGLVDALGETAIFVLPIGGADGRITDVVAVGQAMSPHELRYVGEVGRTYGATSTVAGQALLAFSAKSGVNDEQEEVRRRGYAVSLRDVRGATTVAAPVFDAHHELVGAITIIGPADRMPDVEAKVWPALQAATRKASRAQR